MESKDNAPVDFESSIPPTELAPCGSPSESRAELHLPGWTDWRRVPAGIGLLFDVTSGPDGRIWIAGRLGTVSRLWKIDRGEPIDRIERVADWDTFGYVDLGWDPGDAQRLVILSDEARISRYRYLEGSTITGPQSVRPHPTGGGRPDNIVDEQTTFGVIGGYNSVFIKRNGNRIQWAHSYKWPSSGHVTPFHGWYQLPSPPVRSLIERMDATLSISSYIFVTVIDEAGTGYYISAAANGARVNWARDWRRLEVPTTYPRSFSVTRLPDSGMLHSGVSHDKTAWCMLTNHRGSYPTLLSVPGRRFTSDAFVRAGQKSDGRLFVLVYERFQGTAFVAQQTEAGAARWDPWVELGPYHSPHLVNRNAKLVLFTYSSGNFWIREET